MFDVEVHKVMVLITFCCFYFLAKKKIQIVHSLRFVFVLIIT